MSSSRPLFAPRCCDSLFTSAWAKASAGSNEAVPPVAPPAPAAATPVRTEGGAGAAGTRVGGAASAHSTFTEVGCAGVPEVANDRALRRISAVAKEEPEAGGTAPTPAPGGAAAGAAVRAPEFRRDVLSPAPDSAPPVLAAGRAVTAGRGGATEPGVPGDDPPCAPAASRCFRRSR